MRKRKEGNLIYRHLKKRMDRRRWDGINMDERDK